ncbi:MAG TPA: septum formation protein Maf [Desulfitobacterium dehalogenans]|uniref:dTTP/UTP pyrophosphatase n=1 Tax=Desulfitobacterium dehalogenans TaxID=36854 RepID=A0A7C7D6R7_9FIRM|nr:septum formation protein Maf [Desulfitobacterium dehalogenans]
MLVLASASPRRGMLLKEGGFSFVRVEADVSEVLSQGVSPESAVKELALRKALAGLNHWLDRGGSMEDIILGADTIVVLDHQILGKPKDVEEAEDMLTALSGRAHDVYTGVALINGAGRQECGAVRTAVAFRSLTHEEILEYIATGEPMDKAGSYGIQGLGARLVDNYQGSLSNVIGLPMEYVKERLSVWGMGLGDIALHEVKDGLSPVEGSSRGITTS